MVELQAQVFKQRVAVLIACIHPRHGTPCARVLFKQSFRPCRQGVTHTLDQVFNAPLLIKKVMNDESGITRAFVGAGYALAPAWAHLHARSLLHTCSLDLIMYMAARL